MSWTLLPTDYTDAVWSGLRKYSQVDNADGTVSFQDVTVYSGKEKSFFGALDANKMNEALNTIMSMVENGTDLYEAFQIYFADQKELFEGKADDEYALFVKYLTDLEDAGFTSLTEIAAQAEQSATNAAASATNANNSKLAAGTSATNAETYKNAAVTAKNQSVSAKNAAELAQSEAETARDLANNAKSDTADIFAQTKEIAVRTPYVGTNGNWYVWNRTSGAFEDSGTKAKGDKGDTGATGAKGDTGAQGNNGVAVSASGIFAFNVNSAGHLILSYQGNEAPDFTVNEEGHLIYNY